MSLEVSPIKGRVELEDDYSSRLSMIGGELEAFGKKADKIGSSLTDMGKILSVGVTVPLVAATTASTVFSSEFDDSMRRLVSIAGVSQDELEGVKQHILALAPASGIGPQKLAEAMTVVSSTMSNTTAAMEVLDVAAQGTVAGFGETADVAKALTAIINSYGVENISAAEAGDILAQTIKEGGAEAKELAPTLANVVPLAAQLGVGFDEVGANIATVTKLGVPAAEAVTQLSAVMTAMLKPTKEGSEALASIGMSYDQLRQNVAEKGLQAALADLVTKFGDNKTALADVFGRVEALRNVMSSAGQQAETYAGVLDKVTNSAGSLNKMAAAMEGSTSKTWGELVAQVQVVAIKFGDALAPALSSVLNAAQPLLTVVEKGVELFANLPAPIQTAAIALGAVAAAAGPLLIIVGQLFTAVGTITAAFGTGGGLAGAMEFILPITTGLGTAFEAVIAVLTGPVGWVVAIGAVVAAIITWTDSWGAVQSALEPLTNLLSVAWDLIDSIAGVIGRLIETAFEWWVNEITTGWTNFTGEISSAKDTVENLVTTVDKLTGGALSAWIQSKIDEFNTLIKAIKWVADTLDLIAMKKPDVKPPDLSWMQPEKFNDTAAAAGAVAASFGEVDKSLGMIKGVTMAEITNQVSGLGAANAAASKEAEKHAKELRSMTGEDIIAGAKDTLKNLAELGGVQKLSAEGTKTVHDEMLKAIAVYERHGQVAPKAMYDTAFQTAEAKVKTETLISAALAMGKGFTDSSTEAIAGARLLANTLAELPPIVNGIPAAILEIGTTLSTVAATEGPTFGQRFKAGMLGKDGLEGLGSALGNSVIAAIQGGGNIGEAIGSTLGMKASEGMSNVVKGMFEKGGMLEGIAATGFGSVLSGAASVAIPAFGALAGPLLGSVMDKLFKGEERRTNDLRDQFMAAAGGIEALNEKASAAGVTLDAVLDAKKTKDFEAAVKNLEAAFKAHEEELKSWGAELGSVMQSGELLTEGLIEKTTELFFRDKKGTTGTLFQFLMGEVETFTSGFNRAAIAWAEPFETLVEKAGESEEGLADLQAAVASNSDDFSRFGSIAVGAFEQAQEAGLTVTEALHAMAPGLEALSSVAEAVGYSTQGAFGEMLEFTRLADQFSPLLDQVAGLDDIMTGLHNTGLLTSSMFYDLSGQVTDTFQEMVDGGADAEDAMRLIQPQLQEMWELQRDFGYEVDDATDKLLDQAEAAGIVGEDFQDANDRMADAVGRLINRLEDVLVAMGILPPAASDVADDMDNSFERAADSVDQIPDAAEGAVDDVNDAFNDVDGEPFEEASEIAAGSMGQIAEAAGEASEGVNSAFSEVDASVIASEVDSAASAIDDLPGAAQSAARDINRALDSVDWSGFVSEAVDALNTIEEEGADAAWGSSPTGIKEIGVAIDTVLPKFQILADRGEASLNYIEGLSGNLATVWTTVMDRIVGSTTDTGEAFKTLLGERFEQQMAEMRVAAGDSFAKIERDARQMAKFVAEAMAEAGGIALFDTASKSAQDRATQSLRIASWRDWIRDQSTLTQALVDEIAVPIKARLINAITLQPEDMTFKSVEDFLARSQVDRFLRGLLSDELSTVNAILEQQKNIVVITKERVREMESNVREALRGIGDFSREIYNAQGLLSSQFDAEQRVMISNTQLMNRFQVEAIGSTIEQIRQLNELGASVDDLGTQWQEALADQLTEGTNAMVSGLNLAAEALSELMPTPIINRFMGTIEGLGDVVTTVFQASGQAGGSFLETLMALGPAITSVVDAQASLGRTTSAELQRLMDMQEAMSSPTNQSILKFVAGLDSVLTGLADTGQITGDTFATLASSITNAGVELQKTDAEGLRFIQPTLQKVWELWREWGFSVNAGTAAVLTQAESMKIIGPAFQSAEERMVTAVEHMAESLDGLIDRMTAVTMMMAQLGGNPMPSWWGVTTATGGASWEEIWAWFVANTGGSFTGELPHLGTGGVVMGQTLAMIGERPEAIIPLDRLDSIRGSAPTQQTIINEWDGRVVSEMTVEGMPAVLRARGLWRRR